MKKCPVCSQGNLTKVEDLAIEIEGYIFVVKGEKCDKCNEGFPYEEETQKTIEAARRLGAWL